jgi:KaiC/GvpD/RAD55 family RecA-like ATPase
MAEVDYTYELQKMFIEFLVTEPELYARCSNIVQPEYFDATLRESVEFIQEYSDEHSAMPGFEILNAKTKGKFEKVPVTKHETDWFLGEFEQFCKHKALEKAIIESADLLETQEYGTVEGIIKEAVSIGLTKNLGTDYWQDPLARLTELRDKNGSTSTGWKTIDDKLYGGFNRGELSIFAGGSGAGKSLFLQNLALNWVEAGFNVIYLSLELSEGLTAMRLDSMITGYSTREIFKNIDDVELKVKMHGKKKGNLQIIQLPNGCTVNDIKVYIKEYITQTGIEPQCILVDYLDLMMPAQRKVPPSDLFIKDKFVSEELRNFAVEGNYLFATASQLNRGAVDEIEFDHSHIAGGISKIQTADNVIAIFTSRIMRERGRVQIQFMKTRSSSGVGQKVELDFDINTLRIQDLADDMEETPQENLYEKLKKTSTMRDTEPKEAVTVDQTDRLKSLIKKIH